MGPSGVWSPLASASEQAKTRPAKAPFGAAGSALHHGIRQGADSIDADIRRPTRQHTDFSTEFFSLKVEKGLTDYLTKLLPRLRTGGLIVAHDSSGQAHLMHDFFRAIVSNPDLETVFVDASRWGMCITRKMR